MFNKAEKSQSKLRLAIFGPSGSGKTYTSLSIATGIIGRVGGKIAVIDTERGSASKYADRFDFDVAELTDTSIDGYCRFIDYASGKYSVLIIDSISHAWQELIEMVDKLAFSKYKGNSWSAWSEGTPLQKRFLRSLLSFDGHIIATIRSKTEWTVSSDGGKSRPMRVGLAPEQGKGIEYEFDMLMEITPEHYVTFIKDRTGKYQDKIIDKPTHEMGESLADWLSSGAAKKQIVAPEQVLDSELDKKIAAANIVTIDVSPRKAAAPSGVYVFQNGIYKGFAVTEITDITYLNTVINNPKVTEDISRQCFEQIEKLTAVKEGE
jgi:hypothetical protein